MNITITLSNAGVQEQAELPQGSVLASVRSLTDELEIVGAPSSYNLTIGALSQDEQTPLTGGEVIGFNPVAGSKGA